jgi:hypothetical protein
MKQVRYKVPKSVIKPQGFITKCYTKSVAYPEFFFGGGSTNSVEDRG